MNIIMPDSASNFIQKRTNIHSITDRRIKNILWYVIECYQLQQSEKRVYSKTMINAKTNIKFEDYLKMELVDNYLIKNKDVLTSKVSELEEINFTYETEKRYIDTDGKQKTDKIDIYINKLGLQNEWKERDENLYLAIECKRIKILSDAKDYISDMQKFAQRNHTNLRLPFEGMIAFIENVKLSHKTVSDKISSLLKTNVTISTTQYLTAKEFYTGFDGSYMSSHKKNYGKNEDFTIYHLFFDYSKNVTE